MITDLYSDDTPVRGWRWIWRQAIDDGARD